MAWGDEWGTEWGAGSDQDFVAKAKMRLLTVFRRRPNMLAVAQWLGEQLQQAEEIAHDVKWYAQLRNSFGVTLDKHGKGLGLLRQGLTDPQYREALIVRYAALFRERSTDLIRELLAALSIGTEIITGYREFYPAAFEIVLRDIDADTAARWESILRTAKPEGVRMTAHVAESNATAFRYDTAGAGYDQGNAYSYTLES